MVRCSAIVFLFAAVGLLLGWRSFGAEPIRVERGTLPEAKDQYKVTSGQLPKAPEPKDSSAPSGARHRSSMCEASGCGCGCRGGGPCLCHTGNWDKSPDGWHYWRDRQGKEIAAFDPTTKRYWKKQDGKWVEWKEETRIDAATFRGTGRSC